MEVIKNKFMKNVNNLILFMHNFKDKNITYIKWGIFATWFVMTLYKTCTENSTVVYNQYYMDCDSITFAIFK